MVYSLNLLYNIDLQFLELNSLAVPEFHHPTASSHLNNHQVI